VSARDDATDARLTMLLALRLGGVDHADAVAILDEYDVLRRKAVLAEAADWFDSYDTESAAQLRLMAERSET
jgi:hypothetical protein